MDTLDFIFFFIGIVGFILYIFSEIIIKIDDIMTDKKIDRYFNLIGVTGAEKWSHPVYNRLQDDHYIFAASMDKTKFFFYLCEVIGLQLSVVKAGFYPIDLNPMDLIASIIIIGYLEIVVVLIAVVHFSIFYDSYEDHLEYHEELQKRKNNPNSDDNLEHNKKKKPKKSPKKKNQNSKKKNKKKKDRKEKKK